MKQYKKNDVREKQNRAKRPKSTSWEHVAPWYDELLEDKKDTYQEHVILPNLLRILGDVSKKSVLDLACGQGFFSRALAAQGAHVTGADISPSLVRLAQEKSKKEIVYHVSDATRLGFAKNKSFEIVLCVLALQNMEQLLPVFKEVDRVLKEGGKFVFVVNHPAFRIPKHSSWEYDEKNSIQYRRVDHYLSQAKIPIDMTPGSQKEKTYTWTFHRSLQDYMKALRGAGFALTHLEEWISHKKSEQGPRAKAEDRARKEFPLFLAGEAYRYETKT